MIKWPLNILEFYITASGSQFLLKAYALHFIIILGLNITWKCSWQVSWGSFYKNHPVYLQIIITHSLSPLHPISDQLLSISVLLIRNIVSQNPLGLVLKWGQVSAGAGGQVTPPRATTGAGGHVKWLWWILFGSTKKKKSQCYKTKIFPLEFDVKGQCGKCTYATRSDCCNNTESNSKSLLQEKNRPVNLPTHKKLMLYYQEQSWNHNC